MKKQVENIPNSFIFYRSFLESIEEADEKEQLELYRGIARYALNREEPKFKGMIKAVWTAIKPQLDANFNRFINGCKGGIHGKKGGAPVGNSNAKKQRQNNAKTTPNNNSNVNINKNQNNNDEFINSESAVVDRVLKIGEKNFLNPDGVPDNFPLDENNQVDFYKWRVCVVVFGWMKSISLVECLRFADYCNRNSLSLWDSCKKDSATYYDIKGKPLKNWKGALINFAKTTYDRKQYEVDNGLEKSYRSPETYEKMKAAEEKKLLIDWQEFLTKDRERLNDNYNIIIDALLNAMQVDEG